MTTASVLITSDYVIKISIPDLDVLISELIQSKWALNQRCSALRQRWNFQFWTALIQKKSELISSETVMISSETVLISADVFHILRISPEKRQIGEAALFSADFLWDFNPGSTICYWKDYFSPEGQVYIEQPGTNLIDFCQL